MSIYLDASVIVSLITTHANTARADAFLRANPSPLIVSDFAAAEFASAVPRSLRMGQTTKRHARTAFADLDVWTARATQRVEVSPADVRNVETLVRRLDVPLRTPDALNIAIAQRIAAALATFDKKMSLAAKVLGVSMAPI